jgi:hypothetical protein
MRSDTGDVESLDTERLNTRALAALVVSVLVGVAGLFALPVIQAVSGLEFLPAFGLVLAIELVAAVGVIVSVLRLHRKITIE